MQKNNCRDIEEIWPTINIIDSKYIASIVIIDNCHWVLYFNNKKEAFFIDPLKSVNTFTEVKFIKQCNLVHQIIQNYNKKHGLQTQKVQTFRKLRQFQNNDYDCGPLSCGYLINLIQEMNLLTIDIKNIREWVWKNAYEEDLARIHGGTPVPIVSISSAPKNGRTIRANLATGS